MEDKSMAGRIVAVIESFADASEELTLSELVKRTAIPKPSVHRIAGDLSERGVLERTPHGYRLGLLLFEIGQRVTRQRVLRECALPFMQDLFEASHEVVHLGILDGADVVYVEKIVG